MAQSKATTVAPNQKTPGNKRMLMIGVALLVALLLLLAGAVGYLFLNKNKEHGDEPTRVVVAGSRGKKTIISMIVCALKRQKLAFD